MFQRHDSLAPFHVTVKFRSSEFIALLPIIKSLWNNVARAPRPGERPLFDWGRGEVTVMYLDTHVVVWLYQGDLGRLIVAQARVGGEKLLTKDTASLEHTDLAVWD